jgi:hypothetical protein
MASEKIMGEPGADGSTASVWEWVAPQDREGQSRWVSWSRWNLIKASREVGFGTEGDRRAAFQARETD